MTILIAQILSVLNGIFLLLSMRSKEKNKFLILNSISNAFGFASMIVLGAYAAAVGPIVLTLQGLVTHSFEKRGKKEPKWMKMLYVLLSILGGVITINSVISILPVISSILASIMLMSKDMKTSRKIGLFSSSIALPYLVINKAYVAAIVFASSFVNTLDAIYKIDVKRIDEKKDVITEIKDEERQYVKRDIVCYNNQKSHNKVLVKKLKK